MTTTTNTPTSNDVPRKSQRKWSWRKTKRELYNFLTVLILFIFALPAFWIIFTAFRPGNERLDVWWLVAHFVRRSQVGNVGMDINDHGIGSLGTHTRRSSSARCR